MGPKNACSYADLAMGLIEEKAKFGGALKPLLWSRYRDDVFDVLPKLLEFIEYINSLYPTIKFELVYSEKLPSMSWILHCTFKMGSLLQISMLSLQIAIFIYPFLVLTQHIAKGRFLMGLLYALDTIVLLMSF